MFYHNLKEQLKYVKILHNGAFFELLKNCTIDQCSRVEYFNVLAVENHPNKFAVWFSTSNVVDNRDIKIDVSHDRERYVKRIDLKQNTNFFNTFDFNGGKYVIKLIENRIVKKIITVDSRYMAKLSNNGTLTDYTL